MSAEVSVSPEAMGMRPILNEASSYIQSLRREGISMKEVRLPENRFNAVVYRHESSVDTGSQLKDTESSSPQQKNNLLMLYAVNGEAGGASHISTAFLTELSPKVDTVMNVNSGLSISSLGTQKYDHDLEKQAEDIVAVYKEGIPQDQRDQPIAIVGHSMGGTTGPLVARRLLEEGFNVDKLVLVAPPLTDRSTARMLVDFAKLGNAEHIDPDLPILYPSPADVVTFRERLSELSEKRIPLTPEEIEEKSAYELAVRRSIEPDKLTLTTMTEKERGEVSDIDVELVYLITGDADINKDKIEELQKQRRSIILKAVKKNIPGKIENVPTQASPDIKRVIRYGVRSIGHMKRSISDLAHEDTGTVAAVQKLIDYNNSREDDHQLDITLIAGSTDPIPGDYEIGGYKDAFGEGTINVGKNTTIAEIGIKNFDHFTLPDDPIRVAHVVDRIMDRQAA